MAAPLTCPDISEYQRSLNSDFTGDFVIFRATFGARHLDHKFLANANAAADLYRRGRLAGALLYSVYTSDSEKAQFDAVWKAIGPKVPDWLAGIMIDVETWRGHSYALSGNHSARINRLYGMHAQRLKSWNSVVAYGNASDLAELYPQRDKRCRAIVAAYTSKLTYTRVPGAIGQQYTDGETRWPVPKIAGHSLTRTSAPFGACDHNVFPGIPNGSALRKMLRPGLAVTPPKKVPTPPPSAPYDRTRGDSLVSADGAYAMFLKPDGNVEVRHNHQHQSFLHQDR